MVLCQIIAHNSKKTSLHSILGTVRKPIKLWPDRCQERRRFSPESIGFSDSTWYLKKSSAHSPFSPILTVSTSTGTAPDDQTTSSALTEVLSPQRQQRCKYQRKVQPAFSPVSEATQAAIALEGLNPDESALGVPRSAHMPSIIPHFRPGARSRKLTKVLVAPNPSIFSDYKSFYELKKGSWMLSNRSL